MEKFFSSAGSWLALEYASLHYIRPSTEADLTSLPAIAWTLIHDSSHGACPGSIAMEVVSPARERTSIQAGLFCHAVDAVHGLLLPIW